MAKKGFGFRSKKAPQAQIPLTGGKKGLARIGKYLKRDWQLYLLLLLPITYIVIFHYVPIYGVQIAFRNYKPRNGIMGSEWVGFKWFEKFLGNYNFKRTLVNTVLLSLYSIVVGFPLPIIFALFLNTLRSERLKKFTQSVTYIPHFISVVVLVGMFNQVFSPINGLYGTFYRLLGGAGGYPPDFRSAADSFRHIYVATGIWQNLGWDAIIYTSALSAVPMELHEAAEIDGASRWSRLLHVDLPSIMPTVSIMLILRFGHVMSIGFEKVYLLQSSLNLTTAEVISTYVYKVGMGSSSDFSFGAAVGLFNSAINCILLILVNLITKRLSRNETSLF